MYVLTSVRHSENSSFSLSQIKVTYYSKQCVFLSCSHLKKLWTSLFFPQYPCRVWQWKVDALIFNGYQGFSCYYVFLLEGMDQLLDIIHGLDTKSIWITMELLGLLSLCNVVCNVSKVHCIPLIMKQRLENSEWYMKAWISDANI